jgi:hypothetical protein
MNKVAAAHRQSGQSPLSVMQAITSPFLISETTGNYIAVVTGAAWKLYDDYVDLGLGIPATVIEPLKIVIALATTLLLGLDPYLTIIFAVLTAFVFVEGVAETAFWKAGALIPLVMLAVTIPFFSYNSAGELAYFIGALAVCSATLFAEHTYFPEEISWKKAAVRIINAATVFIFPYMFPQYSYSRAFLLIAFWNLGYTASWLGAHLYQQCF